MRVKTFNGRGLLHLEQVARHRKVEHLKIILRSADVVLVQELHGSQYLLEQELSWVGKDWFIFVSEGPGGVATFIRKNVSPMPSSLSRSTYPGASRGRWRSRMR